MNFSFKKILTSTILVLGIAISYNYNVQASQSFKREIKLYQPSGEEIIAVINGDEKDNWITAKDGSVIIKGGDNYWYYGKRALMDIVAGNDKYSINSKPDYAIDSKSLIEIKRNKSLFEPLFGSQPYFASKPLKQTLYNTTQPLLVLLVEFNDASIKNDDSKWSNSFFGDYTKSVKNYYKEVSNGKFYFTPAVENYNSINDGIIKVKLNYNHPDTRGSVNYLNQNVVKDALTAANGYIDYSKYDKDMDGYISIDELHVITVIAGYEASYSNDFPSVWGHRYGLTWSNAPKLDNVTLGYAGENGGYLQVGEMHQDHMATIGIFCHELGHDLGLPDLYDTDSSSEGVGPHSLMASGSWGYESNQYPGASPTHLDPWSKIYLGFINPQIVTSGKYLITQTGSSGYNVLKVTTSKPNEYFLIENREFNGFDKGLVSFVKNGGTAIWHIDENIINLKFGSNAINNDEFHKGVDIEEADELFEGRSKLDNNIGYNLNSYYYLGNNALFDKNSKPNNILYSGDLNDNVINVSSNSSSIMTIDVSSATTNGTYLNITSTSPINGSVNIPLNASVKITFNADVIQGPNINGITIKDNQGNIMTPNVTVGSNYIDVKPIRNFDYGKTYSIIVPYNSVIDKNGAVFNSQFILNFTTELDKISPSIISTNPINNSLNINSGTEISFTFSEKIIPSSNFSKIILMDSYNKPVSASLAINSSELKIKPSSLLPYGSKYTVLIPSGAIKDVSGNNLTKEFKLIFTTTPQPFSQYNRLSGVDRYQTSISISKMGWSSSKYVVLASGQNFPDALSAGSLAKKYNAPILLTEANSLDSRIEDEIDRLNADNVFIIGGTGVISSNIENKLKSKNISCRRLAGKDRFETAIKVAMEIGTANGLFIANGFNYPDALSIASYASFKGMPILLVEPNSLPESVRQYISSNKILKTFVVGGSGVISDNVFNSLPNPERIAGADRYETNIVVLNRFGSEYNPSVIMIASAEGFPDALSGSVFAGLTKSPMILTSKLVNNISPKTIQYINNKRNIITSKFVLGGTGVVPETTVNYLFK